MGKQFKHNSLRGKLFNKYTGPGNDLKTQLDFNPYTGVKYIKLMIFPLQKMIELCSMVHDVKYTVAENIGRNSKDIKIEN